MSRRTVVVVEEEPLVRLAAAALFAEAGIDVVEFTDGDAAVDYVRLHRDDVAALFTDVYLPGGTGGLELAGLVAGICPEIAVVVTSCGYAAKPRGLGPRVRAMAKPWHPRDVLVSMQEAVRTAA